MRPEWFTRPFVVFLLACALATPPDLPATRSDTAIRPTDPKSAANPDLTPDADGKISQEQMRALTRVVAQNYRENYKKLHDYTFVDRRIVYKLDGKGQVKSTESKTYEIMQLYGEQVLKLIEKDDQPLSPKETAKEEGKIQKIIDTRRNESEEERARREAEREKQRQKSREFVSEIPDAFDFRLVGSEVLNGRDTWVLAAEPRPDFHAHLKEAEMISKFHGRLWIDKTELQFAKMDIEAIDTVAIGWVLARIHKGTRIVSEQTRLEDGVWVPQHDEVKLNMRLALIKSDDERDEETYRDYKKFRTSTKIVGVAEAKDQK